MRKLTAAILLLCMFISGFGQSISVLHVSPLFGDHMVLQQGMKVPVWGNANPGTTVKIQMAGFTVTTEADQDGHWMLRLPEMEAGGPYEMEISGERTIRFHDVMIGEVWLASGQSNMEWVVGEGVGPATDLEVADANYPEIRYFNVAKQTGCVPVRDPNPEAWVLCTPESVKKLSAVAYFFGKDLLTTRKVAVGIISSSWGATSVEAWISAEMLRTHPDFEKSVDKIKKDTARWSEFVKQNLLNEAIRDSLAVMAHVGVEKGVHLPYYNDQKWHTCDYPMNPDNLSTAGYWGFIWFRKSFEIEGVSGIKEYYLQFPINGRGCQVYINGEPVETIEDPETKTKKYILRGHQLILGLNILSVRLLVYWGVFGIGEKGVEGVLESTDGTLKISMSGPWRYSKSIEPELPQKQDYYNKITVLFNGMIAPVIPYGIRGVIWYQGENNTSKAYQYRSLFPMLIEDWRNRWGEGDFPFLFVQLANFRYKNPFPAGDNWAELREAQAMALKYPNTGMAAAIDLGEANDIHPRNKIDVGKRLFLVAQKVAYHENLVYSGPLYESMAVEGSKVRISFTSIGSGLMTNNGLPPNSFAIAGKDEKFYWADAVIVKNQVVVSSPNVAEPVAVRYAWESNPEVNLYNREGLPVVPFRTDQWKGVTQN